MAERTSNKYASDFVNKTEPFKASNTWGEWIGELYVVFSYGYHFPMFAYSTELNQWFENTDKYSRSTSKQQSQLRPNHRVEHYLTTSEMGQLVSARSVAEWVIRKAEV